LQPDDCRCGQFWIGKLLSRLRMNDLIGAVDHEHEIVVAERAEPTAKPGLELRRRSIDVDGADCRAGLHGVVEPAQRPLGVRDDASRQQLALALERNIVGALRRAQRGDHDADDRYSDNSAKRHEHAKPRPIPDSRL
jgi:hypothetical protein